MCQVAGDELKWVKLAAEGDSIVMGSRNGMVLRVLCDETVVCGKEYLVKHM